MQLPARFRLLLSTLMVVLGGIAASGIVAGCTATGALPSTGPTAAASAAPSTPPPAASPAATASQEASLAEPSPAAALSPIPSGATQIDWGVIWDTLPPNFPRYPGAQPTQTGSGPASAILDLPADAPTASTWFQTALKQAGFTIIGANGPREDGSFDVLASRSDACRTEISLAPLGTTTTATIYVAAGCPFS